MALRLDLVSVNVGLPTVGENMSTSGALESEVAIGDRFQWGDAVLEVAQPRWPCFKLTVDEAHRAALPGAVPALTDRVLSAPALAAEWRAQVGR